MDQTFIQENADRLIFALDTGTRSVVGVLGLWEGEIFTVIDYEQCLHRTRAMRDGQIEDIGQVAKAIQTVKSALEQRWDVTLKKVSIAAAGRALKTVTAAFEQDIPADSPITGEQIRSIEYGAVSAALDVFCQDQKGAEAPHLKQGTDQHGLEPEFGNQASIQPGDFSCVGYSVSGYWLDDYPISNLEGHRGKHVKTGIIAAFLPQSVVRSLYAATGQCGLQVSSLTLEPIAAIHAIVPSDLRLLNLAIVDIGAGTSDIAVTRNGSVAAYDMVTLAGDEITEALMRRCLTSFDTAEQIKLSLCQENATDSIPFTDILGNACSLEFQEAMETVEPAAEALCQAVTDCILRMNGTSPAAVFLIGGGSQLGGLAKRLAIRLELPENRVALGGTRTYPHIHVCSEQLLTPEFVTPLGIGAISTLIQENEYLSVEINGQKVMIPGTGSLKIVDALLLAGIRSSSLIGRTPPSLVFYKNSQLQTFRSIPSTPGELYCNGNPAALNTQIRQGDQITLIPAQNGAAPQIHLADICQFGENVICTVNGLPGAPDYLICPQDDVRIFSPETSPEKASSVPVSQQELGQGEAQGLPADHQELDQEEAQGLPADHQELDQKGTQGLLVSQQGLHNQGFSGQLRIQLNGKWVSISRPATGTLCFVDLLNYVNIDPKKPNGSPVLLLNGREASYLEPVNDGDQAEIRWSGERTR